MGHSRGTDVRVELRELNIEAYIGGSQLTVSR
jgi:hypothetical protein